MRKYKYRYSLAALVVGLGILSNTTYAAQAENELTKTVHETCRDLIVTANQQALLKRSILYAPQGKNDNLETVVKESGASDTAMMRSSTGEKFSSAMSDLSLENLGGFSASVWERVVAVAQRIAARALDTIIESIDNYLTTQFNNFINKHLDRINRAYEKTVSKLSNKVGKYGGVFIDSLFSNALTGSLNQLTRCATSNSIIGSAASAFSSGFSSNASCYEKVLAEIDKTFSSERVNKAAQDAWWSYHWKLRDDVGFSLRRSGYQMMSKHGREIEKVNKVLTELGYDPVTDWTPFNVVNDNIYRPTNIKIQEEIKKMDVLKTLGSFARVFDPAQSTDQANKE